MARARREALDRRKFLRMGMLGTVATAGGFSLVGNVAARAAAEDLSSRIVPKRKVAPGLVQAGPELALQPGFSYKTLGLFGTAMSDGFLTPPMHDGMGGLPGGRTARTSSSGTTSSVRATTSPPAP